MNRLLKGVDALQAKGLNVIFITHSHHKNIQTEEGDSYKVIDMALQSFGDYSVPELLKRRSDWVLYVESKTKTRKVKNQFGGTKNIGFGEPTTIVYTRSTSQFFAKVRAADVTQVQDYYEIDIHNPETIKQIFNDIT